MEHSYWHSWYTGWGWFLWIGIWFLMVSSFGNWGYTYKVHRKYGALSQKTALDILNDRYARGEIGQVEFHRIKNDITAPLHAAKGDSKRPKAGLLESPL